MKKYIKPCSKSIVCYDPLMQDDQLILPISRRDGDGEASRESKFGFDEHEGEETETFWDE